MFRALTLFLFSGVFLFAETPEVPLVKAWATDFTNTLQQGETSFLNSRLETYEDSTTNQLVFVMIYTLEDYPLEDYAYDLATKNKIGTKTNNNGALLLVVKKDRKLRIEVGYGLEGVLPDALTSSIIRNVIVPHFKKDEYYAGINAGLDAMISAIAGEYTAERDDSGEEKQAPPLLFIIVFIIIIFLSIFKRGRRGTGGFIYTGGRSSGFGGSSFGGGGFSGGGGSFGGGGSSGGW